MATKSFLKDVVIKNTKDAKKFLNALEKAEKAPHNNDIVNYKTVEDNETIKRIFNI